MVLTLVISLLTFFSIIFSIILFPKFNFKKFSISSYWIIALLGAVLIIVCGCVSLCDLSQNLFSNSSINPIKILCLFFSMTFISIFLEKAGFFEFLASLAAKKAGKKQITLFVIFYFLIALLTVFTSNDIVILTFTPFICYFCKNAKIKPLPYLIAEFAAANTWSMMLIIGNPTNMYLGTSFTISFTDYFLTMALPTLVAGVFEFALIYLIFRKSLKEEMKIETEIIPVKNKVDVIVGLSHLILCIVLLALSNVLHFEMWLISVVVAGVLLLYFFISRIVRKNLKSDGVSIIKSLPWELISFVLSMFVIVISLEKQGISHELAKLLGDVNTIWTYGPSSFLMANLINNIPMSILYSTLPTFNGIEVKNAVYASIIGSNIGAFLTPIGALAGIMFNSLLKEHDVKLSFRQFSMYGIIISVPTLFISLLILSLVL